MILGGTFAKDYLINVDVPQVSIFWSQLFSTIS